MQCYFTQALVGHKLTPVSIFAPSHLCFCRFLCDVGLQHFAEVYTYNATMKNFYDSHFNGAPLAQFESLLFQVDRAQSMADFLDQQRQAEIQHYAEIMDNSDTPTFGRSIQLCPGFSFGLDAFYGLMKRYFRNDVRDLDSTLFKRSCEVTHSLSVYVLLRPISLYSFRFGFVVLVATKASPEHSMTIPMAIGKCT